MDFDTVRANERFGGWGHFCDNAGLAFFVGSVTKFLEPNGKPVLIVAGVLLGIAFLCGAWYIRGLIQPEFE